MIGSFGAPCVRWKVGTISAVLVEGVEAPLEVEYLVLHGPYWSFI
jgi:hypothetical protein